MPGRVLDSPVMEKESRQYQAVCRHYLFAGLAEADFDELVVQMSEEYLGKGEVLFHRGDPAGAFYFLVSGQVELSLLSPGGQKKIIEVIGPGRTFAEAVMFMRESNFPVGAEALSDCTLLRIPNAAYLAVLDGNPDACLRLLSDVCAHLHARVREIERLTVQNARSRLSSYLLDHIVDTRDDEGTIRLDLPRHVIASRLSITPETLSRILRQLVDEGVLTIEDRVIYVRSLARLRPYD